MDGNFYDNPEKFDLEVIAEMDTDTSYEFNIHVAYKHKNGKIYYAHDQGCSCPHPFEDGPDLLREVDKDGFESFTYSLAQECKEDFDLTEIRTFVEKIRKVLFKKETK